MEVALHKKLISGFNIPDKWVNPHRHISALTKGGKVIAYGENNLGGVPKICYTRGNSCHSEMEVLKSIETEPSRKMKKYIMWNIRWSRDGKIVCSKPCYACKQAMLNMGLTTIVFSTQYGTFEKSRIDSLVCKSCK
jgi:deoxycytidylate deaminase